MTTTTTLLLLLALLTYRPEWQRPHRFESRTNWEAPQVRREMERRRAWARKMNRRNPTTAKTTVRRTKQR